MWVIGKTCLVVCRAHRFEVVEEQERVKMVEPRRPDAPPEMHTRSFDHGLRRDDLRNSARGSAHGSALLWLRDAPPGHAARGPRTEARPRPGRRDRLFRGPMARTGFGERGGQSQGGRGTDLAATSRSTAASCGTYGDRAVRCACVVTDIRDDSREGQSTPKAKTATILGC